MNNAIKWGAIMGVALIVMNLILYVAGLAGPGSTAGAIIAFILNYVISIGAMVMGVKAFKSANDGYLSFGQGLGQSVLIGLVGGLISGIYAYIFMTYIDPSAMDALREGAMAGAGDASEDQEALVDTIIKILTSPVTLILLYSFMKVCLGLIAGLAIGAIMKNERPYGASNETL